MRPAPAVAVVLLVLVAGCVERGPADGPGATAVPSIVEPTPDDGSRAESVLHAPVLEPGRAWTYRADGVWMPIDGFTIVVAEASSSGYLFAGAEEEDLADTASWRRAWFGPLDASLNSEGGTLLDFPIENGESWELWGLTVTARFADVATPTGEEPGVVVEGAADGRSLSYEYAPSVGFLTSFEYQRNGIPYERIRLERVGTENEWVWLELGPMAYAGNEDPASQFVLAEGFDAVAVSGGGVNGGRVAVVPPAGGGEAWTFEAADEEKWETFLMPAAAGAWALAASGAPAEDSWAWIQVVPVRWVRGTA